MYYGLKHKQAHTIFCLWKGRMAKNLKLPLATNYLYSSYFLNALTLSHDTPKSHSIMPSNSSLGNYQPKLVQMRSELFSCSSLGLIPSIWFFMTWKFHKIKLSPFHIQHAIIRIGYKTLIALPIKKKKKGRGTKVTIQLLLWWCLVTQLCPTLCDPMGCSLSGSSIQRIFQARILECAAISFSRGTSQPRDQIQVSCIAGRFFTDWANY